MNFSFTPRIMVVEDMPLDAKLLMVKLQEIGYDSINVDNGSIVIEEAKKYKPDIILLDIKLPDINGYEVCRQLKRERELRDIPVLFISGCVDIVDKVDAFSVGAVDYISKPFEFEEVLARIKTHLTIRSLQIELEKHNKHLEELVEEKTKQLMEANRRLTMLDDTKNELLHLIANDLRTPLTGMFGILDSLLTKEIADQITKEQWKAYNKAKEHMLSLLEDALLLTQINASSNETSSKETAIQEILKSSLHNVRHFAENRNVHLPECPPVDYKITGDVNLLTKAFSALFETAVRLSARHERVKLLFKSLENSIELDVYIIGYTIPPEYIKTFFDLLSPARLNILNGELGIKPAIVHRILSLYGCSISVQNEGPVGLQFMLKFPHK